MKPFHWFALLAATQFVGPSVGAGLTTQELMGLLPNCAIECFTIALGNSTCAPTDQQCLCTNAPLQAAAGACIQTKCSVKEGLTATNATYVACDRPVQNRRTLYNAISTLFVAISTASVVLRLISRYVSDAKFGVDDMAITLTVVLAIAYSTVSAVSLTGNGMGRDIWTLTFDNITAFFQAFLAMEILYFTQLALIKISILFFYLRIFPAPKLRKIIHITIGVNIFSLTMFNILVLVQCRPLSFFWHKWDGEHQGTCFAVSDLAWANAAVSIAMDIWMLCLPLTQVLTLNLHWKRKVAVAIMFSVGAFVTIVSIVRIKYLVILFKSDNPTWDYFTVGMWTNVEINVGIICACMPNMRVLLVRAFPKLGTSHTESKNTYIRDAEGTRVTTTKAEGSRGGIALSRTYDVRYSRKQPHGENSQVELVEVHRDTF